MFFFSPCFVTITQNRPTKCAFCWVMLHNCLYAVPWPLISVFHGFIQWQLPTHILKVPLLWNRNLKLLSPAHTTHGYTFSTLQNTTNKFLIINPIHRTMLWVGHFNPQEGHIVSKDMPKACTYIYISTRKTGLLYALKVKSYSS
jgi:hypothetical protein